jgi:hypothetical protein
MRAAGGRSVKLVKPVVERGDGRRRGCGQVRDQRMEARQVSQRRVRRLVWLGPKERRPPPEPWHKWSTSHRRSPWQGTALRRKRGCWQQPLPMHHPAKRAGARRGCVPGRRRQMPSSTTGPTASRGAAFRFLAVVVSGRSRGTPPRGRARIPHSSICCPLEMLQVLSHIILPHSRSCIVPGCNVPVGAAADSRRYLVL